jgi:predicted nucleic acid-binding protein
MTVVIADTSPINYLVLIGEVEVLPRLYHRVVVPEEVFAELLDGGAPTEVREWTTAHPNWLEIQKAPSGGGSLMDLDAGERSAIALAELEPEILLLIDESAGRREASRRGIPNTGTLGVLRAAAIEHLLDLPSVLDRLLATNFRISKALVQDLIAEDLRRKQRGIENLP